MAAARSAQMGVMPNMLRSASEMDNFFDFNQCAQQSLDARTPQRSSAQAEPSSQQATTPSSYDEADDRQVFAGPSHEYDRFKQQTGVHLGDVTGFSHLIQPVPQSFGGFNSGIDDMSFTTDGMGGWSTGLDMDADMNMDFGSNMPTVFPDFVDPSSIDGADEPQSNVGRLWPGMHSQQAQQVAMAKARSQQQRQQQIHMQQVHRQQQQQQQLQQQHLHQQQLQQLQQQQQQQQQQSKGKQRAASYQADPHTEESISRLLNQMRQNSQVSTIPEDDSNDLLPNVARMKKDEEEMDEDERLLASDEGKKLSSKERRQLRNKVSARAFRSRRKGKSDLFRIDHKLNISR